MRTAPALLSLILCTAEASAATIPTYARIDSFEANLYELVLPGNPPNPSFPLVELRDSDTFPVLFSVSGHVDMDAQTITIDQILASGPRGGLSATFSDSVPVSWEWAEDWSLVPASNSTSASLGTYGILFEPITLGTLLSGGPGQDVIVTPAIRVECRTQDSCVSFLLIADGVMSDHGNVRLILDDVLGSVPEPSTALLVLMGIGAAMRRRVSLQPD